MLSCIRAEFLKLRRSVVFLASLAGALVPAGLDALIKLAGARLDWPGFMQQNTMFYAILMGTMLLGLIATYGFARESVEGNTANVLTRPVRRGSIVLAKWVVILFWTLLIGVVVWLSGLIIGSLLGFGALPRGLAWDYLMRMTVASVLMYLALSVPAAVALVSRGYIPPMILMAAATLTGMMATNSDKWCVRIPWSIPAVFALAGTREGTGVVSGPPGFSLAIMAAVFLAGLAFILVYMYKADFSK